MRLKDSYRSCFTRNSEWKFLEARVFVDPKAKDHLAVHSLGDSFMYKAN
jgi:hypothetical protein